MTKVMDLKTFLAPVLLASLTVGGIAGCGGPSYEEQRPPLEDLDPRDRGSLQSKDVIAASDRLAMDLLSLPELNDDREQWTVVVDRVQDQTSGRRFRGDYDIFLRRLETNIARQGRGRIQLIENRETFYDIRDRELEQERDDFGQGEGGRGRASEAVQPDFALRGTAMDMPGRGTTYYYLQFELVDLRRRTQVWNSDYEVRVARR